MSALSEGMVLADKSQLDQGTLLKILGLGALSSPMVNGKGAAILKDNFAPNFPLKHQEIVPNFPKFVGLDIPERLSITIQ